MDRSICISLSAIVLAWSVGATQGVAQTEAIATAKHDLQLGFPIGGRVQKVHVEMGDEVKEGQVLVTLEDDQGEALIELWSLRASSDVQKRLQAKRLDLARLEADLLGEAFARDAAAPFEVERSTMAAEMEAIALEQAMQNFREAEIQLQQARARHEQFVLRAPRDGVIEHCEVDEGETVEQLQPVLRLVQIDQLRVDASVPLEQTLQLEVGASAWVTFRVDGRSDTPVEGTIVHLASVQDAGSNTRRTRIEVPNPAGLPAGCRVLVHFDPPAQHAHASPDATPGIE